MAILACYDKDLNGVSVSIFRKCINGDLVFVEDFSVDGLWFVLFESGSWTVECEGKCLKFDSSGAC